MPFSILFVLLSFTACKKDEDVDKVPKITFTSLTAESMRSGSSEDSIGIAFTLEDADADIPSDTTKAIFLTSTRDFEEVAYYYPPIPDELLDPEKGLKASVVVYIKAAFLLLDSTETADTFSYSMYVKDAAGHQSNIITTPDIYLVR